MKKIVVCGSRTFSDILFLTQKLNELLEELHLEEFELITGACPTGADRMAELWAVLWEEERAKNKQPGKAVIRRFPADWEYYGRRAGIIRNAAMAAHVGKDGICIAFVDAQSKSRGTYDMIKHATRMGIRTIIHKVGED